MLKWQCRKHYLKNHLTKKSWVLNWELRKHLDIKVMKKDFLTDKSFDDYLIVLEYAMGDTL